MTSGNATKAGQHSISQAPPIGPSSLVNYPGYFRPDGKKSVTTKREWRRAKIETLPLPIFKGTANDASFSGSVYEDGREVTV
jgi:hypothetical protein